MSNMNHRVWATSLAGAIALLAGTARAAPLDTREMGIACESTIADIDAAMLDFHFGSDVGRTMNYVSLVTTTGWQGRYWGTQNGKNIDVYYTGTIAPTGGPNNEHAISYSSDWDIDGTSGSGSGEALYTDGPARPDFSFKIDWARMTVSGNVSFSYGLASFSLSGSKDFPNHKMTGNAHVGYADLPIIGELASADLTIELDQLTGEYRSTIDAQVWWGLLHPEAKEINHGFIRKPRPINPPPVFVPPPRRPNPPPVYPYPENSDPGGFSPDGSPGYNNNQVTNTTPEPGVLVLAGVGLVVGLSRRR